MSDALPFTPIDLEQFRRAPAKRRADIGQSVDRVCRATETLSSDLMRVFATAIGLPDDYFTPFFDRHVSALRALNYPPVASGSKLAGARAGEHSDYGSLTILCPDPDVAGLEIEVEPGTWLDAPAVRDGFIINIGDLMQRRTDDRWTSTVHRVAANEATDDSPRRQSIAFFHNPNHDAVIDCLPTCVGEGGDRKYEAIVAGDYLKSRFTASLRTTSTACSTTRAP